MLLEQNLINSLAHGSFMLASVTNFSTAQASFMPLVMIAILVDASIAALWYMAGALLSNNTVKAGAKSEFFQVVATALIAGIVVAVLLFFGTIYYQSVSTNITVLSPSSISPICTAVSGASFQLPGQLITTNFNSGSGTPETSICTIVADAPVQATRQSTELLDYPLAASTVVTASLASQSADALNDLFVLDSYFSFLQKFTITVGVCLSAPGQSCAAAPWFGAPPVPESEGPDFYDKFYGTPLAGFNIITKAFDTTTTLIYFSMASFITQLVFDNLLVFIWPWLLFAGLVCRGIFFLRKLGGLFIAIAIGAILIYPMLFSLEYLATNNTAINGNVKPNGSPGYGFMNQNLIFCGNNGYRYNLNFYQLPSISGIASDCHCWPWAGITGSELLVIADTTGPQIWLQGIYNTIGTWIKDFFLKGQIDNLYNLAVANFAIQNPTSFVNAINLLGIPICGYGSATGTYPAINTNGYTYSKSGSGGGYTLDSPVQYYSDAEGMVFGIVQAYGIIGIVSYFLPIMNIIMTLAGIVGLSGILGGDVDLAGLSRLV